MQITQPARYQDIEPQHSARGLAVLAERAATGNLENAVVTPALLAAALDAAAAGAELRLADCVITRLAISGVATRPDIGAALSQMLAKEEVAAALQAMILAGDVAGADACIAAGVDSADLNRALLTCAELGAADCAALLIGRGADPDAQGDDRTTAVHLASGRKDAGCLQVLLEWGANPDLISMDGFRPAHFAVMEGAPECMRALLTNGVDPNMRDENGAALAHYAASLGRVDTLRVLLEHGADAGCVDDAGRTPHDIAMASEEVGCPGCAGLLQDWAQSANVMGARAAAMYGEGGEMAAYARAAHWGERVVAKHAIA